MMLFSPAALANTKPVEMKITWKGNYAHNSDKLWSKDNPYDSGFSKNFKNGAPEEFGEVKGRRVECRRLLAEGFFEWPGTVLCCRTFPSAGAGVFAKNLHSSMGHRLS